MSKQIKQGFIDNMGEELGSFYYTLWEKHASLYTKWKEYVKLFGTDPSRIELMNKVAHRFFGMVESLFWENIILHITCLTDNNKKNLTIQRLPNLITDDKVLKEKVECLIITAREKSSFCRDWRNRSIAHNDLDLAMGRESAKPLEPASRAKIKEALIAISNVLNVLGEHYMKCPSDFSGISYYRGADALLHYLREQTQNDIPSK